MDLNEKSRRRGNEGWKSTAETFCFTNQQKMHFIRTKGSTTFFMTQDMKKHLTRLFWQQFLPQVSSSRKQKQNSLLMSDHPFYTKTILYIQTLMDKKICSITCITLVFKDSVAKVRSWHKACSLFTLVFMLVILLPSDGSAYTAVKPDQILHFVH